MLKALIDGVNAHEPRVLAPGSFAKAAVLVAVTDHQKNPEVILTLRSNELPTHKGEVAFPGGKVEPEDLNLTQTALREAHEEIGLDSNSVKVLGHLDQVVSRYGFLVTPIIGVIPQNQELIADPGEIQSIFKVPLRYFIDNEPDQIDQFGSFRGPRWYYQDYTIWGLTAMMLAEMLNQFYGANIELKLGEMTELAKK